MRRAAQARAMDADGARRPVLPDVRFLIRLNVKYVDLNLTFGKTGGFADDLSPFARDQ